jgi:hypothetical protein
MYLNEYAERICRSDKLIEETMLIPGTQMALMQKTTSVTAQTRSIVIRWIASFHHDSSIVDETLGQAVYYLDTVLAIGPVDKNQIQLLAIVCFWIAMKISDIRPPSIEEIRESCSIGFGKADFQKCERIVLDSLSGVLYYPTSIAFARTYLNAIDACPILIEGVAFLCETSLFSFELNQYRRSTIAVIAIVCASIDLGIRLNFKQLLACAHFADNENVLPCGSLLLESARAILEAGAGPTYLRYGCRQMLGAIAIMRCQAELLDIAMDLFGLL